MVVLGSCGHGSAVWLSTARCSSIYLAHESAHERVAPCRPTLLLGSPISGFMPAQAWCSRGSDRSRVTSIMHLLLKPLVMVMSMHVPVGSQVTEPNPKSSVGNAPLFSEQSHVTCHTRGQEELRPRMQASTAGELRFTRRCLCGWSRWVLCWLSACFPVS